MIWKGFPLFGLFGIVSEGIVPAPLKEDIYAANKHEKSSSSLVIREMQIKTTLRYHLMLVRKVIIKKSGDNRYWKGCGDMGMLLHCWGECKLV